MAFLRAGRILPKCYGQACGNSMQFGPMVAGGAMRNRPDADIEANIGRRYRTGPDPIGCFGPCNRDLAWTDLVPRCALL